MNASASHKHTNWRSTPAVALTLNLRALACAAIAGAVFGQRLLVLQSARPAAADLKRSFPAQLKATEAEPADDRQRASIAALQTYISVGSARQCDYGLSFGGAVKQQGLAVSALRQTEEKVESDPTLQRRVRQMPNDTAKNPNHTDTASEPSVARLGAAK